MIRFSDVASPKFFGGPNFIGLSRGAPRIPQSGGKLLGPKEVFTRKILILAYFFCRKRTHIMYPREGGAEGVTVREPGVQNCQV